MATKRKAARVPAPKKARIPWDEVKRQLRAGRRHPLVVLQPPSSKDRGWFVASIPSVAGCHTQGRTKQSACRHLAEVIALLEKSVRDEWLAPVSTSCVCCAATEDRPMRLTLTPTTARRLLSIVDKHEARAGRGIKGDAVVLVDTTAIVAEVIAREAKRLRGGGRLPRMRRPAVRVKKLGG